MSLCIHSVVIVGVFSYLPILSVIKEVIHPVIICINAILIDDNILSLIDSL